VTELTRARKAGRAGPSRRRGSWLGVASLVTALALLVAPTPSDWIERYYAREMYPVWQRTVTPLGNEAPFAVFDLWLAVALITLVVVVVRAWGRGGPGIWSRTFHALYRLSIAASVFYLWFMLSWGLNYRRAPLETRLDFSRERVTARAADDLAVRTVDELNRLQPLAWSRPWPA
jgi:hypothetical protein